MRVRWCGRLSFFFVGDVPLKKNGQLMAHHSGQIHLLDEWTCTRIEECRHNDHIHQ
jgi:hypothetical protein